MGEYRDPSRVVPDVHRHCLYCFAPAADHETCRACGRISRPADRRLYWNLNPNLRHLEQVLKVLIAAFALLALLLLFTTFPIATGPGAGWFFLLPVPAALGMWKSASALTRVQPYFRPGVFWCAAFVLAAIALGIAHWSLAPAPLVAAVVVWLAARSLERWKRGLITGTAA